MRFPWLLVLTVAVLVGGLSADLPWTATSLPLAQASEGERVAVPRDLLQFDDGDSLRIQWPDGVESVRILGIDTPETFHPDHDIPHAQPFGDKAAGFLEGCIAVAETIEILRAEEKDPYGRTLAYLYLNGRSYSVLVLRARLAVENVSHYGDNGLPEPAAACLEAAEEAGPVAFEAPHRYRARMRTLSKWLRANDRYPCEEQPR